MRSAGARGKTVFKALICCAMALGPVPAVALGAESPGESTLGSLVVPGVQVLDGGQQVVAAEEARRASPQARVARERSRTAFERLSATAAEKLAGEAFPELVRRAADPLLQLPAGERIVGYPTDRTAQIALGDGKNEVIESTEPLAVETSPGRREPIDLSLQETGGAFRPERSDANLRIPRRIADGVQLVGTGVSLTPVNGSGGALVGSEGAVDGSMVLFANTQADADTVVTPTSLGFDEDTILRSIASPEQLAYLVGLPQGAHLVHKARGAGDVQIVQDGTVLAVVLAPSAQDAAGTPVPVAMSVSGDTIKLAVDDRAREYQFPIDVDPTVIDEHFGEKWHTNWRSVSSVPGFEASLSESGVWGLGMSERFSASEWGAVEFPTQHKSRITSFMAETSAEDNAKIENRVGIFNSSKTWEPGVDVLPSSYSTKAVTVYSQGTNESVAAYYVNASLGESEGKGKGNNKFYNAAVTISQSEGPSASFNTTSPTTSTGHPNVLYTGGWLTGRETQGEFETTASDPGMGVYTWTLSAPGWSKELVYSSECAELECPEKQTRHEDGAETDPMPNGEYTVEAKASDAVKLSATATAKVKVDNAAPYELTLTGLPKNDEIGDAQYHLKASATDGTKPTISSGVASIALAIDGKEIGKAGGYCSLGPCTGSTEWVISGSEFAVGPHTITVTATDNAGNVAITEQPLFVARPTEPVSVGPGSVNPESGELSLSATDVSIGAPGSSLTVTRSYGSMHLQAGAEGPLGPQWTLDLGASQNVTKLPNGNALLTTGNGLQAVYVSKGGGEFTPPPGDEGLKLTEESKANEFLLSDGTGAVTRFSLAPGSSSVWVPTVREGPAGTSVTKITYQTVAGITEPVREIAPVAPGIKSCSPTLEKGCRALEFVYASKTTATGNSTSEWGEYAGRLKEIVFVAWKPGGSETKTAVAQYSYDKEGRLRAEWNPTISPALKVTYGYDTEGHVTAVTSPGQQPELMTYGTTTGDTRTGRLLATTVPSAETAFGDGVAPVNTTAPALSTTAPIEGVTMSVTTGTWSNGPLAYEYQWEHCASTCSPILGATNHTYMPIFSDRGDRIVVKVTATDGDGSTAVLSNESAAIGVYGSYVSGLTFGKEGTASGDLTKPYGVAVSSTGNVWVSDTGNNRIEEFNESGGFVKTVGYGVSDGKAQAEVCTASCKAGIAGSGAGQFKEPEGIGVDKEGNVFVADSGNDRIEEFSSNGAYLVKETLTSAPAGLAVGEGEFEKYERGDEIFVTLPSGTYPVEAIMQASNKEFRRPTKFGTIGSGNGQFTSPSGVALNEAETRGEPGTSGRVFVADPGNYRVQTLQSTIGEKLILEYLSQFGTKGSGNGKFSSPGGLAVEPRNLEGLAENENPYVVGLSNDVLVADPGNSLIEQFSEAGTFERQYNAKDAQSVAISHVAGRSTAGAMYAVEPEKDLVGKWTPALPPIPNLTPEPPNPGSSAVTTIDYHVPITGAGAPNDLGAGEIAAWGQTDAPTEATAIFPPNEPMGWPARDYQSATVYYYDFAGHTTNIQTRSGGISTAEYNATGDVTRTLSADNRAAALKEGCESKEKCASAERAKLLDTESTYNKEGTEVEKTLGPQHTVKLAGGSEVQARSDTQYFYNEGAPTEGGPYRLVTKMTESALVSGKEEETRTTTTSYAGQEGLGWKLRKPTSVTTDPNGLKLTHTIVYEASTGQVAETKSPKGSSATGSGSWAFSSQLGAGDFAYPIDAAVDAHGDVWVTNGYGNEVEEFSASGTRLGTYSKYGAGSGEVGEPTGIAVNQSTGNVYVADYKNNRIDEWSEKGVFVRAFGWGVSNGEAKLETCTTSCQAGVAGSGAGQLKESAGVAVDASGNVWVTDEGNNRVQEFTEIGGFLRTFGFGVTNEESKLEVCTSACHAGKAGSGEGELSRPGGIVVSGGHVYVADSGNNRVEEFGTEGAYVAQFGSKGSGNGQFSTPNGMAADSAGDLYVTDVGNDRIEEFSSSGVYITQFGKAGAGNSEFDDPEGVAVNAAGEAYVVDSENSRVQKWAKASSSGSGAHDSKVVYYTAGTEAIVVACQSHPEWAELPCETMPAEQPGTSGLPSLPVTTITYNIWDEPEVTTETVGSTTRTNTTTYDAAGRVKTSTISSTVGTALPAVTYEYSSETGALVKQCTNGGKPCTEGKPKTIATVYNSVGELTSYTDAGEATTTYSYDEDGRIKVAKGPMGNEEFVYNGMTGELEKLTSEYGSTKLTFTAAYDAEENLLTETYPNGMSADLTYNQAGVPTNLEYVKTTHCTEKCTLYGDSVIPSIHQQWLEQTSTLAHEAYTYDADGRLTQVQSTPAGGGCTTRAYEYDEDTNRTSLTTHAPNGKGECTTEGAGTVENHSYDEADRLTDTGVKYNELGDITNLSPADAGGSELTSTFYSDNQLASETQNGETIGYTLDPEGRTFEASSTGKTTQNIVDHYAPGGASPAWTTETPSGDWTRYIDGIGGGLGAIQVNGATPVLQLENLHGDVVATAALSETETKLLSTTESSEFGVPTTSTPAKYSWLGGEQQPTELAGGEILMGVRSYIPQLGRFLQPDPQPGGSANAYTYTFGDPVNTSDPSGEFTVPTPSFAIEFGDEVAAQATEVAEAAVRKAAEEAAARAAAEHAAMEAAVAAELAGPQAALEAQDAWWASDEVAGPAGGGMAVEEEEGGGPGGWGWSWGGGGSGTTAHAAEFDACHSSDCGHGGKHSCGFKEVSCEISHPEREPTSGHDSDERTRDQGGHAGEEPAGSGESSPDGDGSDGGGGGAGGCCGHRIK
jgi:RHS repeat-associated protein